MLEYNASMSNEASKVLAGTLFGRLFRKSIVSRRLLFTWFVKGRKIISKRLLSLCVKHDGPATIGRSFKFLTFFTSTYEAFVCLHLLLIS